MNPDTAKTIQQILDSLSGPAKEAFEQAAIFNATQAAAELTTMAVSLLVCILAFTFSTRAIARNNDLLESPVLWLAGASGIIGLIITLDLLMTVSKTYATIKNPRGATVLQMLGK